LVVAGPIFQKISGLSGRASDAHDEHSFVVVLVESRVDAQGELEILRKRELHALYEVFIAFVDEKVELQNFLVIGNGNLRHIALSFLPN
jgi:hypothetical protein